MDSENSEKPEKNKKIYWAKALTLDSVWVKYDSVNDMVYQLDLDKRNLYKCFRGETRSHRGYIFRTDAEHQRVLAGEQK